MSTKRTISRLNDESCSGNLKLIREAPGLSHPFLGMGQGPIELGKLVVFLTKIGKFDIVLMYDVSIARLI